MSSIKISAMPSAGSLTGSEQIPVVQSGANVQATPANLATYLASLTQTLSNKSFSDNVQIANTFGVQWPNASGTYNGTSAGSKIFKFSDNNNYFDNYDGAGYVFRVGAGVNKLDYGSIPNAWSFHGSAGVVIDTATGIMLNVTSANTGAQNSAQIANSGTVATTNTAASLIANLSAGVNALTVLQSLGGTTPLGRLFTQGGLTGGLSIITIAGPITLTPATSVIISAGKLITAASVTGAAGFNIPSGTAPTSPADGDMWYDGTNVKFRVGGTTKTFTLT